MAASEDEVDSLSSSAAAINRGYQSEGVLTQSSLQDEYSKFGLKVTCEDGSKPEVKSGATRLLAKNQMEAVAALKDRGQFRGPSLAHFPFIGDRSSENGSDAHDINVDRPW